VLGHQACTPRLACYIAAGLTAAAITAPSSVPVRFIGTWLTAQTVSVPAARIECDLTKAAIADGFIRTCLPRAAEATLATCSWSLIDRAGGCWRPAPGC
jgi:hypothetical protein